MPNEPQPLERWMRDTNRDDATTLTSWGIPPIKTLLDELNALAERQPVMQSILEALVSGVISVGDHCDEPLGGICPPREQLALLAWLARNCTSTVTIEAGFGMGLTAGTILSARRQEQSTFSHLSYDPFGIGNGGGGERVEAYLQSAFSGCFERVRRRSQFAMAQLAVAKPSMDCGLILIDGDHSFDGVLTDFYMADKLINADGFIVIDDAAAPAIATVIQFIRANRADYEISDTEVAATAVLRKVSVDRRRWDHFRPFEVTQRSDWDM